MERDLKQARESFIGVHGRPPSHEELADSMKMTPSQLRGKEQEIQNSDLTSLSSLVMTDGETAIELVDTPILRQPTDPEHRRRGRGKPSSDWLRSVPLGSARCPSLS